MNVQLQNVHKLRKNSSYLFFIFSTFSMQHHRFASLLAFYLGKHCIEAPLKGSFFFFARGTKKWSQLAKAPFYPGSNLGEVSYLGKVIKLRRLAGTGYHKVKFSFSSQCAVMAESHSAY